MKKYTPVWTFLNILFIVVIVGCGSDENVPRNKNFAPVISVFETDSEIVLPEAEVSIRLQAYDLNNNILTYTWSAADGEISGDESGAIWIAPENEKKYPIHVTVSDGKSSTTSTIDIQVWRGREGNYYPLAVGNKWTYRDAEGTEIIFEIIDTIQIQLAGGKTVESYVLEKTNTAEGLQNVSDYSYLGHEFDDDGNITGILQHAQNITPGTEDTIMFVPFIPLYKFPLIPGWKWNVNFQAKLAPELFPLERGTDEFEVLTEETVTVPAGTFENVFQVQESFHWIYELPGPDFDLDITVVNKWLAPNVGIIKFTQTQTRHDVPVESEFELVSYELVNE